MKEIKEILSRLYNHEGEEKCGFVLRDGQVIETKNICTDPNNGFVISPEHVKEYYSVAYAVWHTHPGGAKYTNLSVEDYRNCRDWPDLVHFIISKDLVKAFQWDEDKKAVLEI